MASVLIVDIDPKRAGAVCGLLKQRQIISQLCRDFDEIRDSLGEQPVVILAHCALLNYSFKDLATLSLHLNLKLILYCTDADHKGAETVVKLPEELDFVVQRIRTETADAGKSFLKI